MNHDEIGRQIYKIKLDNPEKTWEELDDEFGLEPIPESLRPGPRRSKRLANLWACKNGTIGF